MPRPPCSAASVPRPARTRALPARAAPRPAAWLLALTLAVAGQAAAEPATYAFDPVHTRVMFALSHAGFSQAIGTVSGSTGTLRFDPGDWAGARVEVSVPLARADLGDADWNRAALAANLLDAKAHPAATFVSTRIAPIDAQHASVFGTLTLHGIAREVKLDVTLNAAKRHPLPPFRRTVGFSATTSISRKAFGITAWPSVIGDTVELRIEAEATRSREGARDADATPAASATPAAAEAAPANTAPASSDAASDDQLQPDPADAHPDASPDPQPATDPTP